MRTRGGPAEAGRSIGASSIVGAIVAAVIVLLQPVLYACPICFQFEPNATTDGVQAAVLVLVGVTVCVLAGFGLFVARLVRRS